MVLSGIDGGKKMKKIVALVVITVVTCLIGLKYACRPAPVTSDMSIIIDYFDPDFSGSTAVLEEAFKTIDSLCSHIFINKRLWIQCITDDDIDHQDFTKQWTVYDTKKGLLYITHNNAKNTLGIDVHNFKKIDNPCNVEVINAIQDNRWPLTFATLFNLKTCQKNHAHLESKICVYMNGHGIPRTGSVVNDLVCGIPATDFAQLITFFNNELNISLLGVQSCYWTTQRIQELITSECNLTKLNFSIITPLSSEVGLWLDTINNYLKKDDNRFCFFDCCHDLTATYTGDITEEIKTTIYNTDTLQLKGNEAQQASLLAAGSKEVVLV